MVAAAMVRRHSVAALPKSVQSSPCLALSDLRVAQSGKLPAGFMSSPSEDLEVALGPAARTLLQSMHNSVVDFNDAKALCGSMRRASQSEIVVGLRQTRLSAEAREAEQMLRTAMQKMETGGLQTCINMAEFHGVNNELILEAKKLLTKIKAEKSLSSAVRMRRGSLGKLESALKAAEKVGVDSELTESAQGLLSQRQTPEGSRRASKNSPVASAEEDLCKAMELRETGALRLTIRAARNAGVKERSIGEAELLLSQLEAELLLQHAARKQDRKKLDEALTKANDCGLESATVVRARQILRQLEARQALSNAISSKDEQQLIQALGQASAAGIERARIEKGEQVLARAQSRH